MVRESLNIFYNPGFWSFIIAIALLISAAITYAVVKDTWYFWLLLGLGMLFLVIGIVLLVIRHTKGNNNPSPIACDSKEAAKNLPAMGQPEPVVIAAPPPASRPIDAAPSPQLIPLSSLAPSVDM